MARREGVEPSTSGIANRRSVPTELTSHEWYTHLESNQGPPLCKSGALPAELCARGLSLFGMTIGQGGARINCMDKQTACEQAKNRKRLQQLGMDYATASNKLFKDVLFSFVQQSGFRCFHCGGELSRSTFSIEHKVPWLDSHSPAELFFDLENISFSHRSCNIAAARRPNKLAFASDDERIGHRRARKARNMRRHYTPAKRQQKYRSTGY